MPITPIIGAVLAWGAPAVTFLAQETSPAPERPRWVAVVFSLLIIACVIAASIKGSKRTHQD